MIPLLALLACPGPPAGLPAPAPGRVQSSAVRSLRSWIAREERRPGVDRADEEDLGRILADLASLASAPHEERSEGAAALLDLVELSWRPPRERELDPAEGDWLVRTGLAELDRLIRTAPGGALGGALERELARTAGEEEEPVGRRAAAAEALTGRFSAGTLAPLLAAGRSGDPGLAQAAAAALSGWADAGVHRFFIEALEDGSLPGAVSHQHLRRVREGLDRATLERLARSAGKLFFSGSWRDAARARPFVELLPADLSVPLLIEALALWQRRGLAGEGSLRLLHEIARELERISGRSLGTNPDRWSLWWRGVREGRVPLDEEGELQVTRAAGFFGLRPESDRVVFVVDRSGSMRTPFGTGERSRYDEAVFQLFRFLEGAGEETSFGVVLFNEDTTRWRTRLHHATSGNLRDLRRWLAGKKPDGGTFLHAAILDAVEADEEGRVGLEELAADTVVVLCDGATQEGPDWIPSWLGRENERAQLVFHCVRIGEGGDGALEALARGTGGRFVHVDP